MIKDNSFNTGWCEVWVKRTKRRKSIAIQVKDGRVQITTPARVPAIDVQLLLEEKRTWIEQALTKQQLAKTANTKYLQPGELYLFQGKRYPLRFEEGETVHISLTQDNYLQFVCPNDKPQAERFDQLLAWYYQQAEAYLIAQTNYHADRLGQCPSVVRIKSYRARWGSCSVRGEIHYNWRLIMAPSEVIDYVVIHELCHLIEHNHSAKFWQLVASLDESYQQHRRWLKQHGNRLDIYI